MCCHVAWGQKIAEPNRSVTVTTNEHNSRESNESRGINPVPELRPLGRPSSMVNWRGFPNLYDYAAPMSILRCSYV